jgi:hypothetical protein
VRIWRVRCLCMVLLIVSAPTYREPRTAYTRRRQRDRCDANSVCAMRAVWLRWGWGSEGLLNHCRRPKVNHPVFVRILAVSWSTMGRACQRNQGVFVGEILPARTHTLSAPSIVWVRVQSPPVIFACLQSCHPALAPLPGNTDTIPRITENRFSNRF